jgi:hypothetical protein
VLEVALGLWKMRIWPTLASTAAASLPASAAASIGMRTWVQSWKAASSAAASETTRFPLGPPSSSTRIWSTASVRFLRSISIAVTPAAP